MAVNQQPKARMSTPLLKPEHQLVQTIVKRYSNAVGEIEWQKAFGDHPEWLETLGGGEKGKKKASNIRNLLKRKGWLDAANGAGSPASPKRRGRPTGSKSKTSRLPTLGDLKAALEINKQRRERDVELELPKRHGSTALNFCPNCGTDLQAYTVVNQNGAH